MRWCCADYNSCGSGLRSRRIRIIIIGRNIIVRVFKFLVGIKPLRGNRITSYSSVIFWNSLSLVLIKSSWNVNISCECIAISNIRTIIAFGPSSHCITKPCAICF